MWSRRWPSTQVRFILALLFNFFCSLDFDSLGRPYSDKGYTTFDLADIYGPAEDFVGAFQRGRLASPISRECSFFTKWVPSPEPMTKRKVTDAVERSLQRMNADRLDLLQFHW